ncbi:MAG: tryptophanyl-tRNA synthetase [Patescibacteria group bacterium]|nr:tryptophanyl-tRNA synthetase [Patescibacteria group bacterium]
MQTILSGIKNTGTPHIGSYLGFYLPLARLYEEKVKGRSDFKLNLFIPDIHALTVPLDAKKYKEMAADTMQNLKLYAACGIDLSDPNVVVYRQSRVPAHSELCVLLNNFTSFGELSRQTQFKDKKDQATTVGLFDYPVLMAADILLYGAKFIPTGEDQRQHLELARDIASRFNNKFGDIFTLPAALKDQVEFAGQEEPVRVMSLSNPNNKMSKSVTDPKGTIDLTDSAEVATKKIMSAETDSVGNIKLNKKDQPGIYNLLQILAIFSGSPLKDVESKYLGSDKYGELKKDVAEVISSFLQELEDRYNSISDQEILDALERGEKKANEVANQTLLKVQKAVGLRE